MRADMLTASRLQSQGMITNVQNPNYFYSPTYQVKQEAASLQWTGLNSLSLCAPNSDAHSHHYCV